MHKRRIFLVPNNSSSNIELWVCPHCDVLLGIETRVENLEIITNCLSCGSNLKISDVKFLTPKLVIELNKRILNLFPDHIHEDIRFSWVSNRTLGIIFSIPHAELMDEIDFNIEEVIVDELSEEYQMNITVYYE